MDDVRHIMVTMNRGFEYDVVENAQVVKESIGIMVHTPHIKLQLQWKPSAALALKLLIS